MDKFITCVSSGKYDILVIKGKPDAETLAKGWIALKSAYLQLVADAETAVELETSIELSNFKLKKQAVESLLYVLQLGYDEDIIAELRTEGYDYPFTADSWQEDAGKVQAELNSEYMHYKLLSGEDDEMEEKPASATPQDVKDGYYRTIRLLQKETGLCAGTGAIEAAKRMTVYDFGISLKDYRAQLRRINDKNTSYGDS